MLGLFALIPVLIAIGVTVADRRAGPGRGLIGAVAGNGLVLPVAAMTVALALLLPLAVAMAAADAIAGEAASGTLRGLLLAPGRPAAAGRDEGVRRAGRGGRRGARAGRRRGAGRAAGGRRGRRAAGHAVRHRRSGSARPWAGSRSSGCGRSGSSPPSARSRWRSRRGPSTRSSCSRRVLGGLIVFGVLGAIPTLELAAALPADLGLVGRDRRAARPAAARRDARRDAGERCATSRSGAAATVARMLRRDA